MVSILLNADFYFGFTKDLYVFPEVTAQHMISILPAPGNLTEQTFTMHIVQNGSLSFVCKWTQTESISIWLTCVYLSESSLAGNADTQIENFRLPFPSEANGLIVRITNDQNLDNQKTVSFLIMPPMINNFGGFDKFQMSLVRIREDEGKEYG